MYTDSESSKRETAYAVRLARGLASSSECDLLRQATQLRKLGRVVIPNMLWQKPGRLHADELPIIRKYPEYGYRMLMQIPGFEPAAELIYCHQEHVDGSGYPRGLKGEQIPIGSRIMLIAATLEAITSDHPYRPAESFAFASEELQRWAGRQFDPGIVEAFTKIPLGFWDQARQHPHWVHD